MPQTYTVFIDDNFHYRDESERGFLGDFATCDEAVAACMRIVDKFLAAGYRPGMEAGELYSHYTAFGEDPFISSEDAGCRFSAWQYARRRCDELCSPGQG